MTNRMTKVTCLVDNAVRHGSQLWGEHGLAFLIEAEAGRVLFDTGLSGSVLLHNLEDLKVAPRAVGALAISHAHRDHTGGLPALLERTRAGIPFYANADLFRERFSRHGDKTESIGLPLAREALASRTALHLDTSPQEVIPGIWTTGEIALRPEPEGGSSRLLVRAGESWAPDTYKDDMSLVVVTDPGLILILGCCHAGLLNTLSHVQRTFERPVVVIAGGTHLVSADANLLQHVGKVLAEMESLQRIYLNHCSGEVALRSLLLTLGSKIVRSCPAGTQLDMEKFL